MKLLEMSFSIYRRACTFYCQRVYGMVEGMCYKRVLWFVSSAKVMPLRAEALYLCRAAALARAARVLQAVPRLCLTLTHLRSAASKDEVMIVKSPPALDFVPLEVVWEGDSY